MSAMYCRLGDAAMTQNIKYNNKTPGHDALIDPDHGTLTSTNSVLMSSVVSL